MDTGKTRSETKSQELPYISDEQHEDYIKMGMTEEQLRKRSENRRKAVERGYNQEEFPYLTVEQYQGLMREGASRPLVKARNEERRAVLDQLRSNLSLAAIHEVPNKMDLRILLLGLSGEGKSATGNAILDSSVFREGKNKTATSMRDRRKITVTKVTQSEDVPDQGITREIAHISSRGIHVFLFVVNISNHRDLKNQSIIWNRMKKEFGVEFVARCILVLTHADVSFKETNALSRLCDEYVREGAPFGEVIRELRPRIVALDNQNEDPQVRKIQQDAITNLMDGTARDNNLRGPYYGRTSLDARKISGPLSNADPRSTDGVAGLPSPGPHPTRALLLDDLGGRVNGPDFPNKYRRRDGHETKSGDTPALIDLDKKVPGREGSLVPADGYCGTCGRGGPHISAPVVRGDGEVEGGEMFGYANHGEMEKDKIALFMILMNMIRNAFTRS